MGNLWFCKSSGPQQPIGGQGLSADCWFNVYLFVDRVYDRAAYNLEVIIGLHDESLRFCDSLVSDYCSKSVTQFSQNSSTTRGRPSKKWLQDVEQNSRRLRIGERRMITKGRVEDGCKRHQKSQSGVELKSEEIYPTACNKNYMLFLYWLNHCVPLFLVRIWNL